MLDENFNPNIIPDEQLVHNYGENLEDIDGKPALPIIKQGILHYEALISNLKETGKESSECYVWFLKLGHYHLVTKSYHKALSAYQKYYQEVKLHYKNSTFLFGLGLVYFHFNRLDWARELFEKIIYHNPNFVGIDKVHFRLALIFKEQENFLKSKKHLEAVLFKKNSCEFIKSEVTFHLGHLCEVQNKFLEAKKYYDQLVSPLSENFEESANIKIKPEVRADACRQLGWLYHTIEDLLEDPAVRSTTALQYLQRSIEIDANNGRTWYFLGRFYSAAGKVHDAFVSYRQSIDKSESNADTWCSIGVLYQDQHQPMDALQAYICAVQLDRTHSAAWRDLAVLYEGCDQLSDALVCYKNTIVCMRNRHQLIPDALKQRVEQLEKQVAEMETSIVNDKNGQQLPAIEKAWTLPIPAELTQRQSAFKCHINKTASQVITNTGGNEKSHQAVANNKQAVHGGQQLVYNQQPSALFNHQQMIFNDSIQRPNLQAYTSKPQVTMETTNIRRQTISQKVTNNQKVTEKRKINLTTDSIVSGNNFNMSQNNYQNCIATDVNKLPGNNTTLVNNDYIKNNELANKKTFTNGKKRKFNEDLYTPPKWYLDANQLQVLNNLRQNQNVLTVQQKNELGNLEHNFAIMQQHQKSMQAHFNQVKEEKMSLSPCNKFQKIMQPPDIKDSTKLNSAKNSPNDKKVELLKEISTEKVAVSDRFGKSPKLLDTPSSDVSSVIEDVGNDDPILREAMELSRIEDRILPPLLSPLGISEDLTAMQVITTCRNLTSGEKPPPVNLYLDKCPPPKHPPKPRLLSKHNELCPPTPTIYLENKKEAMCRGLADFCVNPQNPVTLVRGLTATLKLDLGLFSTRTLAENNPDCRVEVRTQLQQPSDENWDIAGENKVWKCESSRSFTSIIKYAEYQSKDFRDALNEDETRKPQAANQYNTTKRKNNSHAPISGQNIRKRNFKTIRFGTNIDLSNEKFWKPQLQELSKLPWLFRLVSAGNMLSHVGHNILGMNTVQLYMKVPGSRTPGHQENNNFSAININIGPGDCEWFAVPEKYWGQIDKLCEKHGIDYLSGSWWPVLEDLYNENIPVYRFIQKPGDLVWLNAGTVHWVQAIGWCNNIAWNVGLVSAYQYQMAIERYEWNKLRGYKSIVPLIRLTWNMAKHLRITDPYLFKIMKTCMMRTLWDWQQVTDNLKLDNKQPVYQGRNGSENSHYCHHCQVEVFNLLFVKKSESEENKFVVYCWQCSKHIDQFIVLNQHKIEDLFCIYDNFTLKLRKLKT